MARLSKSAIEAYFVSGARPTESQFSDLIQSYQNFSDFLQEMSTALSTKTGVVSVSGSATSAHTVLPITLGGTGETSLASAQNALVVSGAAFVASANIFTQNQTIISSAADATEGPGWTLERRSDSPADADKLGFIRMKGRDSGGESSTYAKIRGAIVSTSAGNENGLLEFVTVVSGASAIRFNVGAGLYSTNASGADRGIDTINASQYFDDGEHIEATVLGTPQATTTGTAFDFTSPFATTTRAIVMFEGVSLDGTDALLVQIGDAGGLETTSYVSSSTGLDASAENIDTVSSTAGFVMFSSTAHLVSGQMNLALSDASNNGWNSSHACADTTNGDSLIGGGHRASLDTVLTTIRITRSGSDDFDAGEVNVRWYGY